MSKKMSDEKNPEPSEFNKGYAKCLQDTEEMFKRKDFRKNKLIVGIIQKLKDLPTWSSRDNIFTVNQAYINKLIDEYEEMIKN